MSNVSGFDTDIRVWPDGDLQPTIQLVAEFYERVKSYRARAGLSGPLPPSNSLIISGGGHDGAFGAGLLLGWSATGTRPEFMMVTGVSAGALIAPFTFLGGKYESVVEELFSAISADDIYVERSKIVGLFSDAFADTRPLEALIAKHVDDVMLRKITEEYEKGRLLFIGTANFDALEPVTWNMGAIAASGHPDALTLFRKVMLASASIPGLFPPVFIEVEIDDAKHEEMHVDGGIVNQLFAYPPSLRTDEVARELGFSVHEEDTLYIIRNDRIDSEWEDVEPKSLNIAARAIKSLIHRQGFGDLYVVYALAQRDEFRYRLAYIDKDFEQPSPERPFDSDYMKRLFRYGYRLGKSGYEWQDSPPHFK